MSNLIIILAHKYPFEPPCEQFLDDEISNYGGDELCIIPCSWKISKECLRKNYQGEFNKVVLFKRNKGLSFAASAFFSFFRAIFLYRKDKKVCEEFSPKNSFKVYYKSLIISRLIWREITPKFNLKNYNKVIIYSYWLNTNAISAFLLKRQFIKTNKNTYAISRAHGQGDLFLRDDGKHVNRPGVFAMQNLDKVFTISQKGKTFLEEEGFLNTELSRLGTYGGKAVLKNSINRFHIVSCSTVNENKNVLEIAKQVAKLPFPAKWTHFGDGPLYDELFSFCSSNTNKNVIFDLKGNVENKKIKEFYSTENIDLFINISTIEGIPVSVMEAMSFGIPCIGTNVGATSEIVINGVNGILIETNQISELSTIISDVYALNYSEKSRLKENAYRFWRENYNATNNYKQFAVRLNNLCDK